MTTRALKSSALVVKGESVPAKPKPPSYEAFDQFVARGEAIRRTVRYMENLERALVRVLLAIEDDGDFESYADKIDEDGPLDDDSLADLVDDLARFRASLDYYTRKEVCDHNDRGRVRRTVISQQVALLIGSVPSAQPHNARVYTAMLTEEINAAVVGPCTLELACREVRRRGSNFAPSIPEMLKALEAASERLTPIGQVASVDVDKLNAELTKLHRKVKRALKIARQKREQR